MSPDCHHVIILLEHVPFLELSVKTCKVSTARIADRGKVSIGSFVAIVTLTE